MAYAWIGRMVPNQYRSHAISRISVVGYAGFFIGPPLMGFLSEGFGLATSFLVIGVLLFATAAGFLAGMFFERAYRRTRDGEK